MLKTGIGMGLSLLLMSGGIFAGSPFWSMAEEDRGYSQRRAVSLEESIDIESLSPNIGNPDTETEIVITAGKGHFFGTENEANEGLYEVHFDREQATKVIRSKDRTKLFVTVPKRRLPWDEDQLYPVRVIIQKKNSSQRIVLHEGFIYAKPKYQDEYMRLDRVYREDDPRRNGEGKAEDYCILEGRFTFLEKEGRILMPTVQFGHSKAQIVSPSPEALRGGKGDILRDRILVRVPKKPELSDAQGWVDVRVINEDGATAIKKHGFRYIEKQPKIVSGDLSVNRLGAYVFVEAEDVDKDGLMVAFGKRSETCREEEIRSDGRAVVSIDDPIGNIRVIYQSEGRDQGGKAEIFLEDPSTNLWALEQTVSLDQNEPSALIRIPWKDRPLRERGWSPAQRERLNDEGLYLKLDTTDHKEKLIVRRQMGEIVGNDFQIRPSGIATVYFKTPYHAMDEDSRITLINADGSDTGGENKIAFRDERQEPIIKDIKYSKLSTKKVGTQAKTVRLYETDYDKETTIIIRGENLRRIQNIRIGDIPAKKWSQKADSAEEIKVDLYPVGPQEIDKRQVLRVYTEDGIAFSDDAPVPVYLKFIRPDRTFLSHQSKYDVPINKTWNIRFNHVLDPSTVTEDNIYIMTAEEPARKIWAEPKVSGEGKIVSLTLRENLSYSSGYYLYIKDVKTMWGSKLEKNLRMYFETQR